MLRYTLVFPKTGKTLSITANGRNEALSVFSEVTGHELFLAQDKETSDLMMDEWEGDGPHWSNPTIPVTIA